MYITEKIKFCEYNLNQINHFNPDPYYVGHFFKEFIKSVMGCYEEILQEANRDFGLFMSNRCTIKNFESKAKERKDPTALDFLSWFKENYKNEHSSPYANFVNKIILNTKENQQIPKISVKILSSQRYKDDPVQEIIINLKKDQLRSKEELQIEVKRQIPIFLEIINNKRKRRQEPKVLKNQIIASTFLKLKDFENIEIPQACKIYLPVIRRILDDSRRKIKNLTNRY